ncbi:GIY-YIG nuclease family protein [Sulfurimonas sp. NW9]|uniref:GIY-YIG nuclease family protein n=1 Tax=Sulfurimonas sp. NW9 TaxID=2922728 RepID=UPI003DAA0B72
MMDKESILDEIFASDIEGILDTKAKVAPAQNEDQRLVSTFEEINVFIDEHGKEPLRNMSDMHEAKLFSRLKGLREQEDKIQELKTHDRHNLFEREEEIEINSIDDIFSGDDFGLLEDEEDIFTLTHVEKYDANKAAPDFVATREKCEEFEKYEQLFVKCQADLREERRRLVPSIERQLHVGTFCILDGVLLYIAEIKHAQRGNSNKLNRRTLLVFENGTQSRMLLRSLGKRLKDNGKMVTSKDGEELASLNQISVDDESTGYIYVLKSKSENDKIKSKANLYKIGFSSTAIQERIKNAENEPTYLMAPVSLVSAYETYNMNPHKLEQLLHKFFGNSCLNIDIQGNDGQVHRPREWFIAPIDVIESAIELIISGDIVNYKYDAELEKIVEK